MPFSNKPNYVYGTGTGSTGQSTSSGTAESTTIVTETIKASRRITVKIDGTDYSNYVKQGLVINDVLSETLDSATIVLVNLSKTLFEPFEKVYIETKNGQKYYMVVNTAVEEICNYDESKYMYTVNAVSQTKQLERVILPNLKIRKPTKKSHNKTIYKYLNSVILPFINKKFPELSLGSTITSDMTKYYCPEIEWSHPNAKQVINDLLGTIEGNPSVCTIANDKIEYLSLAKTGSAISIADNHIMSSENYEQMGDYTNSLTLDAQNIVPPNADTSTPYMTGRNPDNAELTDQTTRWIIPNARIDKVTSLLVYTTYTYDVKTYDANGNAIGTETLTASGYVDIGSRVLEYAEYKTKKTYQWISGASDCRESFIYFNQGGSEICGMLESYTLSGNKYYAIYNALKQVLTTEKKLTNVNITYGISDFREVPFKLTFANVGDARIVVYKTDQEGTNPTLGTGQNQSYVDLKQLTKSQRQQVNRLGNEIMKKNIIVDPYSIPSLGDYIDDYILSQKTVSYFGDFVMCNLTFSKDYTQKVNYYGLQNRRRYTNIALANESVVREEFIRLQVTFNITEYNTDEQDEYREKMSSFIAQGFSSSYGRGGIPALMVSAYDEAGTKKSQFFLQSYAYGGDRMTTITGQCEDNYNVGMKITSTNDNHWQSYVPYVDSYGEIGYFDLDLVSTLNLKNTTAYDSFPEYDSENMTVSTAYHNQRSYLKDNSETLKITVQVDFVSNNIYLIIGDAIGTCNGLISGFNIADKCKVFKSTSTMIDKKYPVKPSGSSGIDLSYVKLHAVSEAHDSYFEMTYSDDDHKSYYETWISDAKSVMITDNNGEIIVAFNKNESAGTLTTKFYVTTKEVE